MVMVRLPVLLCISFCFAIGVSIMSMQLGLLCNDDGLCEWKRNTLYNGCLSEDVTVLKFVYFDASSHAVLSCTSVQVVYIEYTEMTCNEISAVFTTLRPLSVQISGTSCDISPYLTTDMHRGSTKGVEITHYHTTDHKITSQEAEDKFSTLPWPTTQSPQSSSTQASTVGVKVCSTSHPTTVNTEKSAKTTDEHEEGISSTLSVQF
nr:uncharacterized protein LOC105321443 [Crassostrea gigas]